LDIICSLKKITQSYKKGCTILLCKASNISIWTFCPYASLKLASCISIVAASDLSLYLVDILIAVVDSSKTGLKHRVEVGDEQEKRNQITKLNVLRHGFVNTNQEIYHVICDSLFYLILFFHFSLTSAVIVPVPII